MRDGFVDIEQRRPNVRSLFLLLTMSKISDCHRSTTAKN